MSEDTVRQIVNRAILDEKFRQVLHTNPEQALVEYQLTPEEKELFANLPQDAFTEMTGDLEERISRSRGPSSTALWCCTSHCSAACTTYTACY